MKPELSLNKDYILKIINQNLNLWYPQAEKVNFLKIQRVATPFLLNFIVKYNLEFNGKPKKIILRGSTCRKGEKRISAYRVNKYLWDRGFNQGQYQVARSLNYFPEAGLLLYEEFPGENLYRLISKNYKDFKKIENLLKKTSNWLIKLHQLKIKKGRSYSFKEEKKMVNLSEKVFKKFDQYLPGCLGKIKKLWEKILKKENFKTDKMILIHNDFFPGNVIIHQNKIGVIDFVKSKKFTPLADLGSILAYLEAPLSPFLIKRGISEKKIRKLENIFLKNYCQKMNLSFKKTKTKLRIYKARAMVIMATNMAKRDLAFWKNFPPTKKPNPWVIRGLIKKAEFYFK